MAEKVGRLEDGVHILPVRVYYEDTDAAQIVYYANYLRFAERGRTEFLRHVDLNHREMKERDGVDWAIRRCEVDYMSPARLEDSLEVRTSVAEVTGASLTMAQEIYRGDQKLVGLRVKAVVIKADGRPSRLPKPVRETLLKFM